MLPLKDNQEQETEEEKIQIILPTAHCHQQTEKNPTIFSHFPKKFLSQAGREQANVHSFGPETFGQEGKGLNCK